MKARYRFACVLDARDAKDHLELDFERKSATWINGAGDGQPLISRLPWTDWLENVRLNTILPIEEHLEVDSGL
jgi:hypothetical protein